MALWLRSEYEWKKKQTIHWAGSRVCYDYYFLEKHADICVGLNLHPMEKYRGCLNLMC